VGITMEGNVGAEELKNALLESGQYPVKVKVGWTNRTPKVGEDFLPERAYTGDFNKGAAGAPSFSPKISADEVASLDNPKAQARLQEVLYNGFIQAKHRVEDFYKV
jgi:hypothetical protein